MRSATWWEDKSFTLPEIMMVVAIIGLMVVQTYQPLRQKAQNARFIGDMRMFAGAAETYMLETGAYLEDSASGVIPTGFSDYVSSTKWTGATPLGGLWDVSLDAFGIKAGFGVHDPDAPLEQMEKVDTDFDDGDLTTGKFRKVAADRYFYVLEDEV